MDGRFLDVVGVEVHDDEDHVAVGPRALRVGDDGVVVDVVERDVAQQPERVVGADGCR